MIDEREDLSPESKNFKKKVLLDQLGQQINELERPSSGSK
jgi:hypothetical protein